ncbi:MAG: hypothetical protein Ct9H300mP8_13190 [Gammaproteobacteria bacterium]|nr:MAG: hypothetical protein Ct9H300mP8_13190 [Gammaproteobacteria bacterium]
MMYLSRSLFACLAMVVGVTAWSTLDPNGGKTSFYF